MTAFLPQFRSSSAVRPHHCGSTICYRRRSPLYRDCDCGAVRWAGYEHHQKFPQSAVRDTPMTTNLKPADELLSIRQRIKALQAREDEIKAGMKSGELEMSGDFALASLSTRNSSRFDRKAAENELGDLSRFEVKTEITVLTVSELEEVIE